jgi:YVTN family beta-propeller protein
VEAAIGVGAAPGLIVPGFGSIWVSNHHGGSVSRIDPTTNKVVATIPTGDESGGIGVGHGAVWVAIYSNNQVMRIDPATNTGKSYVMGKEPIQGSPAFGFGSLWVGHASYIARVDPASAKVIGQLHGYTLPLIHGGQLWAVRTGKKAAVVRLDPSTGRALETLDAKGPPMGFGLGSVWVGAPGPGQFAAGKVLRFDAASGKALGSAKVGSDPAPAVGHGVVWVYNGGDGTLLRLNPSTMKTTLITTVPSNEYGEPTSAFGSLWVSNWDQNLVYRFSTNN